MTEMRWGGYSAGGHACIVAPAIWPRLLQRHKTAGMCNAEPIQARKILALPSTKTCHAFASLRPGRADLGLHLDRSQDATGQRTRRAVHRLPLWSCRPGTFCLAAAGPPVAHTPRRSHSTRAGPGAMPVQPELCLLHARQRDPGQRSGCRGVFQCQHLECIAGASHPWAQACTQCARRQCSGPDGSDDSVLAGATAGSARQLARSVVGAGRNAVLFLREHAFCIAAGPGLQASPHQCLGHAGRHAAAGGVCTDRRSAMAL